MKKILLLTLLLQGCIENDRLTKTITIDRNFSDEQIELIEQAVEDWRIATNCYGIRNFSKLGKMNAFCAETEIGMVELWQPNAIKKVKWIEPDEPNSEIKGMTQRYDAWMIIVSDENKSRFFHAVKHELGHYLNLRFKVTTLNLTDKIIDLIDPEGHSSDINDLMYPYCDEEVCHNDISKEDIESFNRTWK